MRILSYMLFAILAFWVVGLAVFVHTLPTTPTPSSVKTDAIIVLTGGEDRVERGFAMLAEGAAPVLLISGVGKDVTLADMLKQHADVATRDAIKTRHADILFDYEAHSTQANAQQVAQFVRLHNIKSVRLITAHYHMPRSLAEMQQALPDVEIVPDPVFPAGFQRNEWWRHRTSRDLVIKEFHKSLAVLARPLVQQVQ